jgi:hypothetical protein
MPGLDAMVATVGGDALRRQAQQPRHNGPLVVATNWRLTRVDLMAERPTLTDLPIWPASWTVGHLAASLLVRPCLMCRGMPSS